MFGLFDLPVIKGWRFIAMAWCNAGAVEPVLLFDSFGTILRIRTRLNILQIYRPIIVWLINVIKALIIPMISLNVRIRLNINIS